MMKVYRITTTYGMNNNYIDRSYVAENMIDDYKANEVRVIRANGKNKEINFKVVETEMWIATKGKGEINCYTKDGVKCVRIDY